jgi:lipopolysaccharide export system protein LptA
LVRAEVLLPGSKHPSPADHSPSPEELAALEELTARPETQALAQAKKPDGPAGRPQGPPPKAEKKDEAAKPKGDRPQGADPLKASDEPIKILSKRLEADDKTQQVFFIGQVHATQGLTQLWCDRMVVHYSKEETGQDQEVGAGNRSIKKIEVFGHVKVTKEDKTGLGQRGIYELQERRIVLWGKAKLIQGGNSVNGERVTIYLDDNRAVVEGGEEKVEAILTPSQPKDAKEPTGGKGKKPPPKPAGGRS